MYLGSRNKTRRIFDDAFSRTWWQRRTAWLEIADVYKKVALLTELPGSKYHNHKQLILPLKMANRFIPYVPKPAHEKYRSKPLCKNVPQEFSIFDGSQKIERNPVRVSAIDSDLLTQKVNGDGGIMV
jgi:hypothetical protein